MFGTEFIRKNEKILLPLYRPGYQLLIPFFSWIIPRTAYKIKRYNDIPQKNKKANVMILLISILIGKIIKDLEVPLLITLTPISSFIMYFLIVMFIRFCLRKADERKRTNNTHVLEVDLKEKIKVKTYPISSKNLIIILIIYLIQLGIIYVGIHSLREISLISMIVALFSGFLVCLIPGIIDALCVIEIEGEIYTYKT